MPINTRGEKWLESRKIDIETAVRLGVRSERRICPTNNREAEVLAFPCPENGKVVNVKYRNLDFTDDPEAQWLRFWQKKGGKQVFYNKDAIAAFPDEPLVITEGYEDCISAIEAGFHRAVSVPSGAPEKVSTEPIDPNDDHKFLFIHDAYDELAKVNRIILAVDDDHQGEALAAEIRRRLGDARCERVVYPDGCKDLNKVAEIYGPEYVAEVLKAARPVEIKGVLKWGEIKGTPPPEGLSTLIEWVGDKILFVRGAFCPVTGIPSSGKSTFVRWLIAQFVISHGLRATIASFEDNLEHTVCAEFRSSFRRVFPNATTEEADRWLEQHFTFINPDTGEEEAAKDIDWLLDKFTDAHARYGSDIALIDPWNEVEHRRAFGCTVEEYTNDAIREFKGFIKRTGSMGFIVAHPRKDVQKPNGEWRKPTLFDISGSSAFFNKADLGLVIHRGASAKDSVTKVYVDKAKQAYFGKVGVIECSLRPDKTFAEAADTSGSVAA